MAIRTFEQWVKGIFDHPVEKRAWHWAPDADTCVEPDATRNVQYLTRLFRESDHVLRRFDNDQVNQGLNMIVFIACSQHSVTVMDDSVAWPERQACINAIYDVYAKCFASRCEEALGHRGEGTNPLNVVCYMWWDLFPAWRKSGGMADSKSAETCLTIMERCLTIPHDACVEGALHGLGHSHGNFPKRVESIIDRFLRRRDGLRAELVLYARRAREGNIQ